MVLLNDEGRTFSSSHKEACYYTNLSTQHLNSVQTPGSARAARFVIQTQARARAREFVTEAVHLAAIAQRLRQRSGNGCSQDGPPAQPTDSLRSRREGGAPTNRGFPPLSVHARTRRRHSQATLQRVAKRSRFNPHTVWILRLCAGSQAVDA